MEVIHNAQKYIPSKYYKTLSNIELEDFISSKKKTSKFRFDIKWSSKIKTDMGEEITVNIFVDTKNYSMASNMFNNLDQFKAYLKTINNFDQFYIIQQGGRGVTREQIIYKLKKSILKDAKGVYYTNKKLFDSIQIEKQNIINNFDEFKNFINSDYFDRFISISILTTK